MTAIIPSSAQFVSVTDLTVFQTRKNLIVRDDRGYTDQRAAIFVIQVQFDSQYIKNLFAWMGTYPLWTFLISLIFILPCIICCVCAYFIMRRQRQQVVYKEEDLFSDKDYDLSDDEYLEQKDKNATGPEISRSKTKKVTVEGGTPTKSSPSKIFRKRISQMFGARANPASVTVGVSKLNLGENLTSDTVVTPTTATVPTDMNIGARVSQFFGNLNFGGKTGKETSGNDLESTGNSNDYKLT